MSNTYQLTRIEKIYPNREGALDKLASLSLSFGTIVSVRYLASPGESCGCGCNHIVPGFDEDTRMIIAGYKSDEEGDYFIIADSNVSVSTDSSNPIPKLKIYRGTVFEDQTEEEAISATLFGSNPADQDIIILTNKETSEISTYIYLKNTWVKIGSAKRDIDFDKDQFEYSPKTSKVVIKKIYGGEF